MGQGAGGRVPLADPLPCRTSGSGASLRQKCLCAGRHARLTDQLHCRICRAASLPDQSCFLRISRINRATHTPVTVASSALVDTPDFRQRRIPVRWNCCWEEQHSRPADQLHCRICRAASLPRRDMVDCSVLPIAAHPQAIPGSHRPHWWMPRTSGRAAALPAEVPWRGGGGRSCPAILLPHRRARLIVRHACAGAFPSLHPPRPGRTSPPSTGQAARPALPMLHPVQSKARQAHCPPREGAAPRQFSADTWIRSSTRRGLPPSAMNWSMAACSSSWNSSRHSPFSMM